MRSLCFFIIVGFLLFVKSFPWPMSLKQQYEQGIYSNILKLVMASSLELYQPGFAFGKCSLPIYFCTGFRVPKEHYKWLYEMTSTFHSPVMCSIVEDRNSLSGDLSLYDSAKILLSRVGVHEGRVIFGGHSRGGAVSSIAASLKNCRGLILIDPVDDDVNSALSTIRESPHRFPVAIIATPFGGKSKYYNVEYTSACAPENRNAEAFLNLFLTKRFPCFYLRFPQIGHAQLLDDWENTLFGSACASGEKRSELLAKLCTSEFLSTFLQDIDSMNPQFVSSASMNVNINRGASQYQDSSSDYEIDNFMATRRFLHNLTSKYPTLQTEWQLL